MYHSELASFHMELCKWQFVCLCVTHHSSRLWPPDAKNWLTGKDPNAGKDWMQKDKGMALDEMARWHQWLSGHEQTPGDREGQGGLVCCSPCGGRVRDDLMRNTTKILEKSFFFLIHERIHGSWNLFYTEPSPVRKEQWQHSSLLSGCISMLSLWWFWGLNEKPRWSFDLAEGSLNIRISKRFFECLPCTGLGLDIVLHLFHCIYSVSYWLFAVLFCRWRKSEDRLSDPTMHVVHHMH